MPYHTPLVSEACEKLEGFGVPSEKRVQECPVASNFTGGWLNAMMLKTGHYWVDQMEKPVQWHGAAAKVIGLVTPDVVVEMGPGNSLSFLTSLCVPEGVTDPAFVQAMGHPKHGDSLDVEMLVQAFRLLSDMGVDIDWEALDLPECCTTLSTAALAQHLESCSEAVLVKDAESLSDQMTNDGGSDLGDFMSPASSYASKDGADVPNITLGIGSYCYDLVFG
jgi:acyl transferase domain-containing protein